MTPASDEVTITMFKAAPPSGENGNMEIEQIVIFWSKNAGRWNVFC